VLQGNVLTEFQIHSWSKEIEWGIKNTLEEMRPERKLESPILGEMKPLKNRGIPRRNQEIATKGSRSLSTGVLESWGRGFPFIAPKRNLSVGVSETRICLGRGPDMSG
jgi:hypothetical protein